MTTELEQQLAAERERADYAWRNTNTIEKARQDEMAKRDAAEREVALLREALEPFADIRFSDVLERTQTHLRTMAPHVRERLTAQLLKNVLAHAKELEESLRYVETYLESAAKSEDEAGLLMSAKPLLGDVRKFLRFTASAATEG